MRIAIMIFLSVALLALTLFTTGCLVRTHPGHGHYYSGGHGHGHAYGHSHSRGPYRSQGRGQSVRRR